MKIVVIGASRGIGREVVKTALKEGHIVTAFSRNPATLDIHDSNLKLMAGNVLDITSLKQAITDNDVVVCTLGLPTLKAVGPPLSKRSYVLSEGTNNILSAMAEAKIKRFICITAIGTGESINQCTILTRITLRYGLRWLFKEKDRQEEMIKNSNGIDWTIIRPTALTKGRKRGALVGEKLPSGILTHISRADVAAIILELVSKQSSYKRALTLSYPPRLGDSIRWVFGYFGIG